MRSVSWTPGLVLGFFDALLILQRFLIYLMRPCLAVLLLCLLVTCRVLY